MAPVKLLHQPEAASQLNLGCFAAYEVTLQPPIGEKHKYQVETSDLGDSVPSGDHVPSVVAFPMVILHFYRYGMIL